MIQSIAKSLFVVGLLFSFSTSSHADDRAQRKKDFAKNHPRRAQVLNRANKQKNINNAAAADGKLTNGQAQKLDREDQGVKNQEQRQAAENGGHITKGEQRRDDREENHIADQRQHMENRDAANGSAPAGGAPAGGAPAGAPPAGTAPTNQ